MNNLTPDKNDPRSAEAVVSALCTLRADVDSIARELFDQADSPQRRGIEAFREHIFNHIDETLAVYRVIALNKTMRGPDTLDNIIAKIRSSMTFEQIDRHQLIQILQDYARTQPALQARTDEAERLMLARDRRIDDLESYMRGVARQLSDMAAAPSAKRYAISYHLAGNPSPKVTVPMGKERADRRAREIERMPLEPGSIVNLYEVE